MLKNRGFLPLSDVVWDPTVYPRKQWSTATIERYVDALKSGDEFPPLVLETGTNRLLDGKHRVEAHIKFRALHEEWKKKSEEERLRNEWQGSEPPTAVAVEWHTVPEDPSAARQIEELEAQTKALANDDAEAKKTRRDLEKKIKHLANIPIKIYAAQLSARHGDRMSNADLKALALEDFEIDPTRNVSAWGRSFGVSHSTVFGWVGHMVNRAVEERRAKALRLSLLGWLNKDIANHIDVDPGTVTRDLQNVESDVLQVPDMLARGMTEYDVATRMNLPVQLVWAVALQGKSDAERVKELGLKTQPYDVWQFSSCHDLMGDKHPGRIPGELVCHVLYFYTNPGDLVVDPMAGSGTTLDACLLMGRKARGYDIDHRHERIDIERHDLSKGWPEKVAMASLVFWDPPYFDKMDHSTIGSDGYVDGSVSGKSPDEYLAWFGDRFAELYEATKPGTKLAFLMSDWDSENAKAHTQHSGIFIWDYVRLLQKVGWKTLRRIQCPLPTQQVHPDIVNKFRESRRLARLNRDLVVCQRGE